MKTEAKHTPTPWTSVQNGNYFYIDGAPGETGGIAKVYDEDNAEFIVRACNTHEGLLEAAIAAREELVKILKEDGGCDHSVGICWCDYIRKVEALDDAIAKAEGRS